MDDILVDVGRTGKLTFTGIFHDPETGKPARLCGTSVSRATLHNQDYITQMNVGIGGEYKLFKSGEIIPKLNGCVKVPEHVFEAPKVCPVCGERIDRERPWSITEQIVSGRKVRTLVHTSCKRKMQSRL